MRTRDEIQGEFESKDAWESIIILEVLLDIREMLEKVANPIYVVDSDKVDLRMVGIHKSPFITTIEIKEPHTDCPNHWHDPESSDFRSRFRVCPSCFTDIVRRNTSESKTDSKN